MKVSISTYGEHEVGSPPQWWSTVFVWHGSQAEWVGATGTVEGPWTAFQDGMRLARTAVASQQLEDQAD